MPVGSASRRTSMALRSSIKPPWLGHAGGGAVMAATSSGGPGGERAAAGEALDSDRSRTPEQRPRPGVPRTVAAAALLLIWGRKP
jgi:hypothetical protein